MRTGTVQERRGEGSNSPHVGANYQSYRRQPPPEGSAFPAEAHRRNPLRIQRHGAGPARPSARGGSRPPAGPGPLWGRLGASRACSRLPLTFCSSAEAASGTSADILLPLQTRHWGKKRLSGGRGCPATSNPPVPARRAPARAASAREDGRRFMTTRSSAALGDSGPPATRASLPRRAPAYLTPLLRLSDAEALPFFLQRSRLAPRLISVRRLLSGTCSL